MNTITIAKTTRSPEINFDFGANRYAIKGESYPEDVSAFYGHLLEKIETHFSTLTGTEISFRFELIYFNSSTAKILMELFELLDEAGKRGNTVTVTWAYEQDDDNVKELGEEFGEDLKHATFTVEEIAH